MNLKIKYCIFLIYIGREVTVVSIHKIILIFVSTLMLAAGSPVSASAWETVFEIHSGSGRLVQENIFQTLMDPQSIVTVGIEVKGIRIGYDSRHGFAAVKEF